RWLLRPSTVRGAPPGDPYSPSESRPGETEPSRRVDVSWSGSKDRATHTRAPPFHRAGRSGRPARILSTPARHRLSSQAQDGSRSDACGLMAPTDSPGQRRGQVEVEPAPVAGGVRVVRPARS